MQSGYLKDRYEYLSQNWENIKPTKVTTHDQNKFENKMGEYGEGHHYQEFLNLFRRIKTRNDMMPYDDDKLIERTLLMEFLKDIQTTTDEQALFDPPNVIFKWPFYLKNDTTKPDSIENINPDNDAWLQLDPVGNSSNTPTIGAVFNEVLHCLADLPEEHNFKFGLFVYSDTKSFPPSYRTKSYSAESSAHLDNANSNQKQGTFWDSSNITKMGLQNRYLRSNGRIVITRESSSL